MQFYLKHIPRMYIQIAWNVLSVVSQDTLQQIECKSNLNFKAVF